nr:hypothetical protein [uncultured Treponema sp.]
MEIIIVIFAIFIALLIYGIVQVCRTPKEETERRKPYKILIIISSAIAGFILVACIFLFFLLMLAVTHM